MRFVKLLVVCSVMLLMAGCATLDQAPTPQAPEITGVSSVDLNDFRIDVKKYMDNAFMEIWRHPVNVRSFDNINDRLMVFNIWAILIEKGGYYDISAAEKAVLAEGRIKAVSVQKDAFPVLRWAYGQLRMSGSDIHIYGADYRTIEFVGPEYSDLAVCRTMHRRMRPLLEMLRFERAQYRPSLEQAYYGSFSLNRFTDGDIVVWDDLATARKVGD